MTTLPILIDGITVLTFDISNQDIILNKLNTSVKSLNTTQTNNLCKNEDCYQCIETQCNEIQCIENQCNQIKCNSKECNTIKCTNKRCTLNCSYDSIDTA